jgi:serine/threonine protein kinase
VVGRLGGGAMTEVHLCMLQGVEGFEKEVAVRRLTAEHATDPRLVRIFLEEARVAAKLSHRNIVQVFEVGEGPEGPYIAMEYVRGVTLAMVTARAHQLRKIHYGHFAKLIAAICDALAYAHGALDEDGSPLRIVHRDITPANIVVSKEGIPKLLDFGMART